MEAQTERHAEYVFMTEQITTGPVIQGIFENGIAYPWKDALGRLQANKRIGPHLGEFKGLVIMEGLIGDSRTHISYWDRPWLEMRARKRFLKKKRISQRHWNKYHKDNPLESFFQ